MNSAVNKYETQPYRDKYTHTKNQPVLYNLPHPQELQGGGPLALRVPTIMQKISGPTNEHCITYPSTHDHTTPMLLAHLQVTLPLSNTLYPRMNAQ